MTYSIKERDYKIINIGVNLFLIFPFLFLIYLYISSNGDVIRLITETPKITISFIGAMIIPFVGLNLKNIKDMIINKSLDLALISLLILFLSQILIFNIIGILITGTLTFRLYKIIKINFNDFKVCVKSNYTKFISSGLILLISIVCFVLSFRL